MNFWLDDHLFPLHMARNIHSTSFIDVSGQIWWKVEMGVLIFPNYFDHRMISVIEFESKGKGAFALRKKMKVLQGAICLLRRNPLNPNGKGCCHLWFWWDTVNFSCISEHRHAFNFLLPINLLYYVSNLTSITSLLEDANNVIILAPGDVAPVLPANYGSEEHIGNLCREHAKVLARLMDSGSYFLAYNADDCNIYSEGFVFTCTLLEDTNHTASGYAVQINVCTNNSKLWIQSLFNHLLQNDLNLSVK